MKTQIVSGMLLAGIVVACAPIDRATVVVDATPPVVYRSAPSVYVAPAYVAPVYPRSYYYGSPYYNSYRYSPYYHSYGYGYPIVRHHHYHHRGFYR